MFVFPGFPFNGTRMDTDGTDFHGFFIRADP